MATIVTATCSECFQEQEVELGPRRNEIVCRYCRHSVPMFEKRELDSIRSQVRMENGKMLIALAIFGGAVFLFFVYTMLSMGAYKAEIVGTEDSYEFIKRDDSSMIVEDVETGEEIKHTYSTLLSTQIEQVKEKYPLMNDEQAAKRAGEDYIRVVPPESSSAASIFFYLSVLAGLASIVFSAIASQDRLVCEF